ncbi:PLP-dependent transferase [Hypoxylon crocopeplum]|nr:PLP-dependent transferase [Hypoxylon crocopeplum]
MDAEAFLTTSYAQIRAAAAVPAGTRAPTLPSASALIHARSHLPSSTSPGSYNCLLEQGLGPEATLAHLTTAIAPALAGHNRSSRYFGFVTGSTLPVAEAADNLVSAFDNSVQVHLPEQSIVTEVEDAALRLLLRLLELGGDERWEGRTFTTGATASNILGLECGREVVVSKRLPPAMKDGGVSVGELGIIGACAAAGIREIQVLTSMGHSSLSKAASVVGLGRHAVKELPRSDAEPWGLDVEAVERELQREGVASIIAVSAGEVNTGRFATSGADMRRLRELADKYGAWIHVDGAFGIFARALPNTDEFARFRESTAGLELADSITVDGHKLLNVPYDTGIFFTRHSSTLHAVFQNPNAVYLSPSSSSSSSSSSSIPSPLNIGIENSRRFRALPVYAVLLSEGRRGIAAMQARMVQLARGVASALVHDPNLKRDYELLPDGEDAVQNTHVVVLFRARDAGLNDALVPKIQASGEWYVSGTKWKGRSACRIAVASWRVDVEEDLEFVKERLARIAEEWKKGVR